MAYVIADNTGSMLVYHSGNERSVGDKINISGAVTIYQAPNNPPQFDKEAAVEVVSTGNAWNYDFKEYSVDDVNAYFNNIVCTPIILKGKVVKEESNGKTFYNLELDGADATVLQGSVQYYTPDADKLDVPVAVKGYAVGKSQAGNITRIKIFPYEITVNSTDPYITATAPATFKAEGETINVAFNAGNLGSNKVFAKIEGTDAGQFTLGAVGANSVPVTAKANDGAAKSAKLTLYVAASEGAAAVKTTSVDLKQAAKQQEGTKTATFDFSTITETGTAAEMIVDGIKLTPDKAAGSNPPGVNKAGEWRLYRANSMTISGATITNIEITFSSTSYMGADFVAAPGTYTTADKIGTWTGSATSVVFTNGTTSSENVQARMKKIVVTYKE